MFTVSPQTLGELVADLAALAGHVEPAAHRAGQPQNAVPEPVATAVAGDLDQAAGLQRAEQPGRGRLVHADGRRPPRTRRPRPAGPGIPAR